MGVTSFLADVPAMFRPFRAAGLLLASDIWVELTGSGCVGSSSSEEVYRDSSSLHSAFSASCTTNVHRPSGTECADGFDV